MERANVAEMSDKRGFSSKTALAASRDSHIIGISWDVYTLASKGMPLSIKLEITNEITNAPALQVQLSPGKGGRLELHLLLF